MGEKGNKQISDFSVPPKKNTVQISSIKKSSDIRW